MSFSKVDKTTGELYPISGGILYADAPIGSIIPFGGSAIPSGFLLCDGSEVLKTSYSELYSIIGDSFGTASVNTKFKLPDLRETVPVGSGTRDNGVSDHDTYTVGQFKDDQMQNAEGHFTAYSYSDGLAGGVFSSNIDNPNVLMGGNSPTLNFDDFSFNLSNVARTGTTTHGKQMGVNYIIKAVNTSLPLDFQQAVDEVQQNVDTLSDDVNTLSENVDTLSDNVGTLSDNVSTLSDNVDTLSDNVESITPTVLVQTLTAGSTSLTFTDPSITNNSRIIITTDPYTQGAVANAVQNGTTVTVTFNAQSSNIRVALEIRN